MGVYIKSMEMPDCCFGCPLSHPYYGMSIRCGIINKVISSPDCEKKRLETCPLVLVPPHGRLIDGDLLPWVLANKEVKFASYEDWEKLCDYISAAPTVIPAEESE